MTTDHNRAATLAALNDAFRSGARPELGRIMIAAGARDSVAAWPLGIVLLHDLVKRYSKFTTDNDPYGEHDFGSIEHVGQKFFWKIDYFDRQSNLTLGTEYPDDPAKCERVLTIMLASEY
jgi:hypothetical protein